MVGRIEGAREGEEREEPETESGTERAERIWASEALRVRPQGESLRSPSLSCGSLDAQSLPCLGDGQC